MDTNQFWTTFNKFSRPDSQQLSAAMDTLPGPQPELTEDYIQIQSLYQFLFSLYFLHKTSLDRLDARLCSQGCTPAGPEDMDFFQMYDLLSLRCFYLRTLPRIERLSQKEHEVLSHCLSHQEDEAALMAAMAVVEQTYGQVMALCPKAPEQWFELYPSLLGEGRVQGKNIVLTLKTVPDYDAQGMLKSREADDRRTRIMASVKAQLEPLLKKSFEQICVLISSM